VWCDVVLLGYLYRDCGSVPCPRTASLHACLNLCSNSESKDRLFTDINLREREGRGEEEGEEE
jgi:hypothetical protein